MKAAIAIAFAATAIGLAIFNKDKLAGAWGELKAKTLLTTA